MHPKFKFQNGGRIWKSFLNQSCSTWKVEQLSFLEIFNFFRKFLSNLRYECSGSSVIISKFHLHLTVCRRRHAEFTADRFSPLSRAVTRPNLRGEFARVLSSPYALKLAINRSTSSSIGVFPSTVRRRWPCCDRPIHPRRTTSSQLRWPAAPPCPAAHSWPARLASSRSAPPREGIFFGAGRSSAATASLWPGYSRLSPTAPSPSS